MKTEIKTYKPKNTKTLLLGLASLVFVISGILMMHDDPVMGWFISLFFGICLLVFVIQLIPGSTELKLTNEGFEITNLFRKNMTKWTDVKSFKIGYVGQKTIMYDFVKGHNKYTKGKLISKKLSGSHAALPTTYGLKAFELLQIMNEWKNKYGTN